jgi:hypothetical protein
MLANHPFNQRSLNVRDENGMEGCATCGRPRGHHPDQQPSSRAVPDIAEPLILPRQIRAASMTHVAGLVVNIGPHMRQRCAWCGATLLDYHLDRMAVPAGQDPTPATWQVGALVTVDGPASYLAEDQGDDKLPEDACARLDDAVTL